MAKIPQDPHDAPTILEMSVPTEPPPRAAPMPSGPRPVGELLKDAFELYKSNWKTFLVVVAVVMAPVFLVKDLLIAVTTVPAAASMQLDTAELERASKELETAVERGASQEEIQRLTARNLELAARVTAKGVGFLAAALAALLGLLLTIPLMVLANWLSQAALVVSVADRARDGALDWKGVWGVVLRRLGPLLLTTVVAALITAVGILLCVVPGVVFAFLASLAAPAVLLERKSGMDAIKRSIELVKRDWLRVLIVFVIMGVLSWVAQAIGGLFVPDRFVFLNALAGDLVSIAVAPFAIIGMVLLFNDIRRAYFDVSDEDIRADEDGLLGES